MALEDKALESTEKTAESTEKSTGPKGGADTPDTSRVEKDKDVVLPTTPEDPSQALGDHVSFAYLLYLR